MQKKWAAAAVAGLIAVAGALAWYFLGPAATRFEGKVNALGLDLRRPVAYVATPSLVGLVRDLVKAPVLREVLTEDLVFYYEAHEDRLSAAGTLRRLAYEHDTRWSDELLALALDQPTEMALWADSRGAARYWALAMSRDALAQVIHGLGALATQDSQLSLLAELPLDTLGMKKQAVYALSLSNRRTLAIAARGARVVVFSDPGFLVDNQRQPDMQAVQVLNQLLGEDQAGQHLWREHLGLTGSPDAQSHSLVAGAALLAQGYQRFVPGLQGLRVDVAAGGASLHTWLRTGAAWTGSPWAALPAKPAACSQLPVDWALTQKVLESAKQAGALGAMARHFEAPAAICWYANSQLHTPVLAVHASGQNPPDATTLDAFMRWWLPASASWQPGESAADIPAPYGALRQDDKPAYRSAFRRAGDWWLFSPDETLVNQAEKAIARRYPSVADTLGAQNPVVVATPSALAQLLKREAMAVLPRDFAGLRQAAETQLLPRLAALGKLPAVQAVPQGQPDAQGWVVLDWKPLAGAGDEARPPNQNANAAEEAASAASQP